LGPVFCAQPVGETSFAAALRQHACATHQSRVADMLRASNEMNANMSLRGAQRACPRAGGGSNLNPTGGRREIASLCSQ